MKRKNNNYRGYIFLGYIDNKRLIYDPINKRYLYGVKEEYNPPDLEKKIFILTVFSYPFIKLINDNFIVYSTFVKILIIIVSAIFILFMANKWRTAVAVDVLTKYRQQALEPAYLDSEDLINHLAKVKKSVILGVFTAVILLFLYIVSIVYYMWKSKFIGIFIADCILPFSWVIFKELKVQNILENINYLIDLENKNMEGE